MRKHGVRVLIAIGDKVQDIVGFSLYSIVPTLGTIELLQFSLDDSPVRAPYTSPG